VDKPAGDPVQPAAPPPSGRGFWRLVHHDAVVREADKAIAIESAIAIGIGIMIEREREREREN
jgi:hypothetical protein